MYLTVEELETMRIVEKILSGYKRIPAADAAARLIGMRMSSE
jgi:hypothetical protein